ncbi:hypothetical protein BRC81_01470 [Halobacteriales archaeon QS_1_68_20]|nr:MAG: hypothetical protein BRC81_01470 [Halobacteriales archaeon QS_1_68_20]
MIGEPAAVWWALLLAVGLGYLIVAYRSLAVWDEPGGELFSGLGLAIGLGALVGAAGLQLGDTHQWSLLSIFSETSVLLLPVLWAGFAARRAGANWLTRRRASLLTAGIVLATIEFRVAGALVRGTPESAQTFNLELVLAVTVPMMITYLFSSSLIVVGVALLVKQTLEYEHLPGTPVAAVAVGVLGPWVSTWLAKQVAEMFDPTNALIVMTMGYGVGFVGFALSYERYGLFAESAAAGTVGRNRVIATMDDTVIVVDDERRVLDINPAATELFEVSVDDVAGRPIEAVVDDDLSALRSSDVVDLVTGIGPREFEPTVSTVTGPDGDHLGYSVVLRDVTERRNREQRLSVLNRVLRHNLRNEMSIVSGYADMLVDRGDKAVNDEIADEIAVTANELVELGEKARVVEELMAEPPTTSEETAIRVVASEVVEEIEEQSPDCEFDVQIPGDLTVGANPRVLRPIVANLIENAVEHNDAADPRVEIRATREPGAETVSLTVVDNGPGIPDQEREVLESGDVTPLEHGSGLGLWVSKWGAKRLGGTLSLAAAEPRGTVATLRVPESLPPSAQASLATS